MEDNSYKRTYRFFNSKIHSIGNTLRDVTLPGFQGVAIYDVFWFFMKGIQKGSLNTRASSISFNFLLALGPAIIFLFSLISFLPVTNMQAELLDLLANVIPENSYEVIESILTELFTQRPGLTSFGLLTSLFFAQKGVHGIIESFHATYHSIETRTWYKQRAVSLGLVFVFYFLVLTAFFLVVSNKLLVQRLVNNGLIEVNLRYHILMAAKWLILMLFTFFLISSLYYLGPSRKVKWRFFSAGSTLATLLTMLASIGFTYFMNNFAQLNKFFGSIGALMALMLWMNFNALTLLIGFELNASINHAHTQTNDI